MNLKSFDEKYMRMALRLAEKARGRTSPNPMVGAVVVKDGKVISRGWHRKAGEPHAEAIALKKAGGAARGATLYVTLEPCSHTGKRTPPCSPLVIQSGITRVVVAMTDPNPKVSRGGVKALSAAGIDVITGVVEPEARKLNEAYIKHIIKGMPFVTLKIAQTLDGKIATAWGESKWITGEKAREEAHRLRDINDAVLVGINTVLKDNPSLTTRIPGGRDPVRVIVDSTLRIPLNAKVLTQKSSAKTIVATLTNAPKGKTTKLQKAGVEVLMVKAAQGRVDLRDLMKKLGKMDIMSVLVEGGAEINYSALKAGIVDKAVLFIAPMLMTGKDALCSIGGTSPVKLSRALRLRDVTSHFVGQDLMFEGYIR
ncbi:MAG TPA: bifunctional diaminohydroxyphosphoribosylaminopyrimidine deaminase/5-amino-6-(5-phosphoribosylamino)uracil reductase RibD [Nitrospirota bacterium]|nr:bifunctional diaminohydroxyphosphoribosylaminopyrimidine deaminase/5-amino-6-(5-phosphoribosylamino)uracil reductase RibD [Nitrospirota bacterium]